VNKQFPQIGLTSASRLWQRLTTPTITLKDTDERIRSRFLAQLFLLVSLVMIVVLTLRYILWPNVPNVGMRLAVTWIGGVLLLVSYIAVHKGYTTVAGVVLVIQTTILILTFALLTVTLSAYQSTLTFLVLIIFFSSQFYSIHFTLLVAVFHLLVMLSFPLIIPFLALDKMLKGPISFYLVSTALAIVFSYYRSRIEEAQRRKLAESETRFKMVSDLIPNYAFSVTVEKGGLVRNEWVTEEFTRLTGYTITDIDGGLTAKLFHPDDLARYKESVKQAYEGQSSVDDYRIYTKLGELRWLRLNRHVVWDNTENRMVRYYGVAQDITAQKLNEAQQLEHILEGERSKLVRDFVTAISHDFRNSLSAIETSRYLAEHMMQKQQTEPALAKLGSIHRGVTHMTAQLENLDAIATLTHLQRQPCDLNTLLGDVVAEYMSKARQHNQMIVFQPNGYVPRVSADAVELSRAFRELLRNALSFMPSGGVVTIKTFPADKNVRIDFQDTGIGIAPEHLDHVFEHFYRVDAARGLDSGGVGLGLSVTKMIVVAHGGKISVESTLDVGSIFTVGLPVENPN
jgi:PAS domain S-box-containing protein